MRVLATALLAAFLLTACGGGAMNSPLPSAKTPGTGGSTAPSKKHKVKATIRITIPKKKGKHHRVRVHGHYVSPATASIAITLTLNGGSPNIENANLTPATNPNCVASLDSPLICNVQFSLEPGSYSASFSTYDGPLAGDGSFYPPTGNLLSANYGATFNIVAGQDNAINVSLDGVATSVALVPGASSSLSGSNADGYTMAKCGTASANSEHVSVFGVDADGNYIIGPGAPTVTLLSGDSSLIAVATPPPASPNVFTLSHPISSAMQNPATLTATAAIAEDAGGGLHTAYINMHVLAGTALCGQISLYGVPGGPPAQPAGITPGPDGNLWFTESGFGDIGKITTDGSNVNVYNGANYPWGIVTGPDNNLWFSDFTAGIGTVTTGGVVTMQSSGLNYMQRAQGIAPDATAGVWVTENDGYAVAYWDGANLHEHAIPDGTYSPNAIVRGPDNNYWFTLGSGQIGKITTMGAITTYTGASDTPQGITVGPDNALWFTEAAGAAKIGRMTTAGTVTNQYALPAGFYPTAITLGPDNNLWFINAGGNPSINRITTDGTISTFAIQGGASPQGITAGPDGNIWFTECGTGYIGRLQ